MVWVIILRLNHQNLIGAEVSYSDYGSSNYVFVAVAPFDINVADLNIRQQSIDFLSSYQFNFNDSWFTQVKLGLASVTQKTESSNISVSLNEGTTPVNSYSIHKIEPLAQLAIGYKVSQQIQFSLMYQHLFGASAGNPRCLKTVF